jgi:hypothetical protein
MSLAPSSTQHSLGASEILDPVHSIEAGSSISSTPRPQIYDGHEAIPLDVEPEVRVRYYCTYPNCEVPQKDCKTRHEKCRCLVRRERYWSEFKVDIKRHEEGLEHWPRETFVCFECFVANTHGEMCKFCSMPVLDDDPKAHCMQCECARANTKTFSRKDHLLGHLQRQHGSKNMGEETKSWSFRVDSDWPRQCGFCPLIFDSWNQRMAHLAWHFDHGARIQDWRFPRLEPKDRKLPDPFFYNSRKDEDDDDNDKDDGYGGSGVGSRGKLSGNGTFAGIINETQYGQSSSFQEYKPFYQQDYNQQGYGASQLQVTTTIHTESSVKLSLALERYLKDSGDRVPGLGTAPVTDISATWGPSSNRTTAFTLPEGKCVKSTSRRTILLHASPGCGKALLARQYINQYSNNLDKGFFWVNAKMQPEVKDSFLDIAAQSALSLPANSQFRSLFLRSWWQNTRRSLCGLPLAGESPSASPILLDLVHRGAVQGIGLIAHLTSNESGPPVVKTSQMVICRVSSPDYPGDVISPHDLNFKLSDLGLSHFKRSPREGWDVEAHGIETHSKHKLFMIPVCSI